MAVTVNNKRMTVGQAGILKDYLQADINVVGAKADALIGTDTGKSARAIANEELAAQLIPDSAKESLDTLEEIAAWIQAHPDDAATMNAAINKNTADIASNASAIAAINDANTGIAKAAKDYADGLNSAMNTRVEELEAKAAAVEVATDDEFKTALGITTTSDDSAV